MPKGRIISGGAGGVIALFSLILPYIKVSGTVLGKEVISGDFTLLNLLDLLRQLNQNLTGLYIIIGLIVIGSILALAHPSGGMLQLLGCLLFGYGVMSEGVSMKILFGLAELNTQFHYGYYLAIIASVTTLAGFASTEPSSTEKS